MRVTIKPRVQYEVILEDGLKESKSLGVFLLADEWEGMAKLVADNEVLIIDCPERFDRPADIFKRILKLHGDYFSVLKASEGLQSTIRAAYAEEKPEDAATGTIPA